MNDTIKARTRQAQINKSSLLANKIKGMLYGYAIADALGVPYEFKNRGDFDIKESNLDVHRLIFSDDTSMTLCLIENMLEHGNVQTLMDKFLMWYEDGYLGCYDYPFGIGITTEIVIQKYLRMLEDGNLDLENIGEKDFYSNGNGALMRISPLVIDYVTKEYDNLKVYEEMQIITNLTHGHPISDLGCYIYLLMMIYLLKGYQKQDALDKTIEIVKKNAIKLNYQEYLKYYQRLLDKSLFTLDEDEIKSSGYVVDTLEAVLYMYMKYNNYNDVVLNAINLGDDADTIGAIAGSMVGLDLGISAIDKGFLNRFCDKVDIDDLINRFVLRYVSE